MSGRRLRTIATFVACMAGAACGRSAIDPGDEPFDASRADGGRDAAIGLCAPGDDQTCNDDPTVSALWGTCVGPGVCQCRDGFSKHPKTGRCRPGNACEAAGGDVWPVTVSLDQSGCALRPLVPCTAPVATDEGRLTQKLFQFAMDTCHFPQLTLVRVEFVAGCPSVMNVDASSIGGADPTFVSCMTKALSTQRWSCAADGGCAVIEFDTI